MYDGSHKPKDAAGALELVQRRPLTIEAVKQLRMYRVGNSHPPRILTFRATSRELCSLTSIQVGESLHRRVTSWCTVGRDFVEKAPSDNFEAFIRGRRS